MSTAGISAQINQLLTIISSSSPEKLGITRQELDLLQTILSKVKGIIDDGIQKHEIYVLIGLLEKLSEILGEEFEGEILKIIKKLRKFAQNIRQDNTNTPGPFQKPINNQGTSPITGRQGISIHTSSLSSKGVSKNMPPPSRSLSHSSMQSSPPPLDIQSTDPLEPLSPEELDLVGALVEFLTNYLLERLTDFFDQKQLIDKSSYVNNEESPYEKEDTSIPKISSSKMTSDFQKHQPPPNGYSSPATPAA